MPGRFRCTRRSADPNHELPAGKDVASKKDPFHLMGSRVASGCRAACACRGKRSWQVGSSTISICVIRGRLRAVRLARLEYYETLGTCESQMQ